MSSDPWTAFLDWLTTVLVPSWGELIGLLPFFVVLGVVGPLLTLIVALWGWYLLNRRRGRVRRSELQAVPAPTDADGVAAFPPNVPFCETHELLYPPRARTCEIDGGELGVRCPVDDTVRAAGVETCPACGTRYVLGAGTAPTVVAGPPGPPEGGAAVA